MQLVCQSWLYNSEAGHAVGMPKLVIQLTCNTLRVGQKLYGILRRRQIFAPKSWCSLKKRSSFEISLRLPTFRLKIMVFFKKKVFVWDQSQISLISSQNCAVLYLVRKRSSRKGSLVMQYMTCKP